GFGHAPLRRGLVHGNRLSIAGWHPPFPAVDRDHGSGGRTAALRSADHLEVVRPRLRRRRAARRLLTVSRYAPPERGARRTPPRSGASDDETPDRADSAVARGGDLSELARHRAGAAAGREPTGHEVDRGAVA